MGLDLVAQEDPATTELVAGDHAAAGELERRGERQMEEGSDLARVENVVSGESWAGIRGRRPAAPWVEYKPNEPNGCA